ncbi:hypothetical protein OHC33_006104 [Knufia fluminis]|uniref:AB hydrolase-1 domain-containing protein n=1 Tax=Knufia fluminis TaxID=191047 RepID=A0AAN8EDM2_9EURO|nr:hypothetical protein OHC33_006104 [Knufia fluminis]
MPKHTLSQFVLSTFLFFSHQSLANPIRHGKPSSPSYMSCAAWTLPVHATADNVIYDVPRVDSNIDAADYAVYEDTWTTGNITERTQSILHVDDTFGTGVQLCVPTAENGAKKGILEIASHGLGFDKRYWDVEVEPDTYSYVRAVVKAGYSILTYDRLGTGSSDKPDAYNIVQATLQLEILKSLTMMARDGSLAEAAKPHFAHDVALPAFAKTVHIGHSFGSALTNALQAKYPELSDGAIQTGWVINDHLGMFSQSAFGYQYAPENDPKKFGDRGSGYIVVGTKNSFQQLFLAKGMLDPKLLDYGDSIKQPGTVGENAPAGLILGLPATDFTGPQQIKILTDDAMQFFLAERDLPICDGNCTGVADAAQLKATSFPKASAVEVYVQPGTGHGLALHKNATAGYQVMLDFLGRNGL